MTLAPTPSPPWLARLTRTRVLVAVTILAVFLLAGLLGPLILPYGPTEQDLVNRLGEPSLQHPLGTDELGRDVLSRLVHAIRVDVPVGLIAALCPAVVGTVLGLTAGYAGGWLDAVVSRASDIVQAVPSYILVIALVAVIGQGVTSIIIAFTVVAWVVYSRLVRAEVLRVRSLAYVEAARTAGLPTWRVISGHVLPNVIRQTAVYLPSDVVFATVGIAAFSYLGLGVPPPTPEWGAMIAEGQPYLRQQWWLATVPGLVIVAYGLALSLLGEELEEGRR